MSNSPRRPVSLLLDVLVLLVFLVLFAVAAGRSSYLGVAESIRVWFGSGGGVAATAALVACYAVMQLLAGGRMNLWFFGSGPPALAGCAGLFFAWSLTHSIPYLRAVGWAGEAQSEVRAVLGKHDSRETNSFGDRLREGELAAFVEDCCLRLELPDGSAMRGEVVLISDPAVFDRLSEGDRLDLVRLPVSFGGDLRLRHEVEEVAFIKATISVVGGLVLAGLLVRSRAAFVALSED